MLAALLSLTALGATVVLLALALFHVRFRAAWNGAWNGLAATEDPVFPNAGAFRLEIGFPGFMKPLAGGSSKEGNVATETSPADVTVPPRPADPVSGTRSAQVARTSFPDGTASSNPAGPDRPTVAAAETPADTSAGADPRAAENEPSGTAGAEKEAPPRAARAPRAGRDPNRLRRALFRVATDGHAWKLLRRFVQGTARRAFRLLGLRAAIAVGHPDPARLGRTAGAWYAVAPLLPLPRALAVEFRFQDRRPSLDLRAEGAFSALSLLAFGGALVMTFPWIGLGRRAWYGWRNSTLTGWRAWTYAKIQKL